MIVRGAYFRISADGTLHGPDNAVVAKYLDGLWQLMHGRHRVFDCRGPVFLRVTNSDGTRERVGPYEFVRAAGGAIFTHDSCLAVHDSRVQVGSSLAFCQEIAFLSGE